MWDKLQQVKPTILYSGGFILLINLKKTLVTCLPGSGTIKRQCILFLDMGTKNSQFQWLTHTHFEI